MTKTARKRWPLFRPVMWLLLISLFVVCWNCKKPEPILIPIGAVRIVGVIEKGIARYVAGEDPLGDYNIVTPAFILKFIDLAYKVKALELELKLCREKQ